VNLNALRAFVVKEFHHILRDRQTLTILLMLPLVQVILFGYALRSDVRDIRMAVIDPTPDHATLELQSRFLSTNRFRIVTTSQTPDVI
jgi:ABC-2 type transport system permease protein